MTTGERIKAARKSAGITQKELADRLGISYQGIAQWENDLRNPKRETLHRIADALGVTTYDLMGQTEGGGVEGLDGNPAYLGVAAMLKDIYGDYQEKSIAGDYAAGTYYLVGKGKDRFILERDDIDKIVGAAKAAIPPIVEAVKRPESEDEYVRTYLESLNSDEAKAKYQTWMSAINKVMDDKK